MDSFLQTKQESDSSPEPRILNQLNKHHVYVFFDRQKFQYDSLFHNMQKMTFKMKQQRYSHADKYLADNNKNIQLSFHDLTDQSETHSGLIELKNQTHDCKVRIVVYGKQSILIRLLQYAKTLSIKMQSIPIVIYSPGLSNDLSRFLGWGQVALDGSMKGLQNQVKKWVCSLNQKIDAWNAYITVHEDIGQIYRYNKMRNQQTLEENKQITEGFFSHVSIGTHPKLARDFSQGRNNETGFLSNFMYKLQSYKKFCCVGQPNMRTATGVVNARFTDQNGDDHQILRQFHNEDNLDERQKKIYKHRRRILSIVVSNIDYYHGSKINNYQGFKMNDNKLQLLTFQSQTDSHKIASIAGEIKLNLQSEKAVYVQVNDVCFRLINPKSLIIKQSEKYRVSINKQSLEN